MDNELMEPTISIPVDLYNPGQFFACCGLLELAHQLAYQEKDARQPAGWFENTNKTPSRFSIRAISKGVPVDIAQLIKPLKECEISTTNEDSKEGPVLLGKPFNLTIDWRPPFPQNSLVKTFAGQQNIFKIVQALQNALPVICDNALLNYRGTVDKSVTAFSVERAEDSIDAGFSMDVHKDRLFREPPVILEFLTLIGTQRFCPQKGQNHLSRIYYAWRDPLPAPLAAIAASQYMAAVSARGFKFQMYKRDPDGRYKGFALSKQITL